MERTQECCYYWLFIIDKTSLRRSKKSDMFGAQNVDTLRDQDRLDGGKVVVGFLFGGCCLWWWKSRKEMERK